MCVYVCVCMCECVCVSACICRILPISGWQKCISKWSTASLEFKFSFSCISCRIKAKEALVLEYLPVSGGGENFFLFWSEKKEGNHMFPIDITKRVGNSH